jgi:formylglycine-generating enzyme required for sulfatase activity
MALLAVAALAGYVGHQAGEKEAKEHKEKKAKRTPVLPERGEIRKTARKEKQLRAATREGKEPSGVGARKGARASRGATRSKEPRRRPPNPRISPNRAEKTEVRRDAKTGITWVKIPAGKFQMGSKSGESSEKPVHEVRVKSFWMAKTEVTVAQYKKCVEKGPCSKPSTDGTSTYRTKCNWDESGYDKHPVNCVTWHQAKRYCEKWAGGRLPSEAEWEYAARSAGQDITYPWGDEKATCHCAVMRDGGWGCGTGRTMEVCSKKPGNTDQGLCDMAGSVCEWVEDDWHYNYKGAPDDGSAWLDDPRGSYRVLRDGGFSIDSAVGLRAANRNVLPRRQAYEGGGFRCARDGPPKKESGKEATKQSRR